MFCPRALTSIASDFCGDETEPRKLHTSLTRPHRDLYRKHLLTSSYVASIFLCRENTEASGQECSLPYQRVYVLSILSVDR